jgi:transcriptional regulator with XRE-family HTH domain
MSCFVFGYLPNTKRDRTMQKPKVVPSKRHSFHNSEPTGETLTENAPVDMIRAEFAKRLQAAMTKRGWTQSELSREAAKHSPDKKFGRDLISQYVRQRILPGPKHLHAMCKALGLEPADLLPVRAIGRGDREPLPPMRLQGAGDGRVLLQINQTVDTAVALKIVQLLEGKQT